MSWRFKIIDSLRNTNIVKDFKEIKKEYNLGYEYLLSIQKNKLINLLSSIRNNTEYSSFVNDFSDFEIHKDPYKVLKNIPFVDKAFINRMRISSLSIESLLKIEKSYTGGSTGIPLVYYIDKKSVSRMIAFNYFLWNKYLNYNLGDKILVIAGSSLGAISNYISKFYNALQNKKYILANNITDHDLRKGMDFILDRKYDIIYGYPSSIEFFTKHLIENHKKYVHKIKGIVTTSEMLSKNTRDFIEGYFNTNILNIYGARDGGIMSGEYLYNTGFIYNIQDCLVENTNTPENFYELVLTNLNSYSFPFVRYKVGDIGQIDDTKIPIIKNIEGRYRDLLVFNNTVYHGSIFNKIIIKYPFVTDYQLIQKSSDSIDIILHGQ
ncbi:MAG: phenylacetate--CoA ligase family protein, partial [Candidatus Lokiarchaeota archaeon]|nr:phenylacetate--CoA ligase family protein [Candidatus Lokiarchaeota archaeon]